VCFEKFMKKHPETKKLTEQRFYKHTPFWLKPEPRQVCVCYYHEQAKKFMEAHRRIQKQIHPAGCQCACDFCSDNVCQVAVKSFDDMAKLVCCPDGCCADDIYAADARTLKNPKCMLGECEDCGFSSADFMTCPKERDASIEVTWSELVKTVVIVPTSRGDNERKKVHTVKMKGALQVGSDPTILRWTTPHQQRHT
jgi:hypothetical protein